MARTQTIVTDADLTPLQWQLVGSPTHTAALNSAEGDGRFLSASSAGLVDHLGLSIPSNLICEATQVDFNINFLSALLLGAANFNLSVQLYKDGGATLLGFKKIQFFNNGLPHDVLFEIVGLSFDNTEAQDLTYKLVTDGVGWVPVQAIMLLDKMKSITIHYTAPPTEKTIGDAGHTEKTIGATAHTEKVIAATAWTEDTIPATVWTEDTIPATSWTEQEAGC